MVGRLSKCRCPVMSKALGCKAYVRVVFILIIVYDEVANL
jgi:hypothetical protein